MIISNIEILDCAKTGTVLVSGFVGDEIFPKFWKISGESLGEYPDLSETDIERAMIAQSSLTFRYIVERRV